MPEGVVRVQLDWTEDRVEALDALVKETQSGSRKNLLDQAFLLLVWAVEQRKKGREIMAIDEDRKEKRVLEMPTLSVIKAEV